jgi:hypothetical protein
LYDSLAAGMEICNRVYLVFALMHDVSSVSTTHAALQPEPRYTVEEIAKDGNSTKTRSGEPLCSEFTSSTLWYYLPLRYVLFKRYTSRCRCAVQDGARVDVCLPNLGSHFGAGRNAR